MSQTDSEAGYQPGASEKSIRLFENDTLEALSHVHPIIPLVVWSPLVLFLLYHSERSYHLGPLTMSVLAATAILGWTFFEYFLHRFIFHFPARSNLTRNLVFTFHGVHHATPQDKTRLVMPPTGALLFMGIFWLLFDAVLPDRWVATYFAFFLVGYLIYDYIHYAIHHFPMRNPVAKYLKTRHLQHHFRTPNRRYGVSSPLWDFIFRSN